MGERHIKIPRKSVGFPKRNSFRRNSTDKPYVSRKVFCVSKPKRVAGDVNTTVFHQMSTKILMVILKDKNHFNKCSSFSILKYITDQSALTFWPLYKTTEIPKSIKSCFIKMTAEIINQRHFWKDIGSSNFLFPFF